MNRILATSLLIALGASCLGAQTGGVIESGVSRRIAEVLGDIQVDEKRGIGLADLGAEIEIALIDIDPDTVANLNAELIDLKQQERDLLDRLDDLESGLPIVLGPAAYSEVVIGDITEATLELAQTELNAQQAEIARLERLDQERESKITAERAARQVTPLSTALLATLEDLPAVDATATTTVEEPRSEFPLRIARALFVSGDYVGSLRQFRQVPAEDMTFQGRFEMARCLEETNAVTEALEVLKTLVADTTEKDSFWNARATALSGLIAKSQNIRTLMQSDRARTN